MKPKSYEPEAAEAVAAIELSCSDTAENASDMAGIKDPLVRPKVMATSMLTNARIAPYSVIPCADSSRKNLVSAK